MVTFFQLFLSWSKITPFQMLMEVLKMLQLYSFAELWTGQERRKFSCSPKCMHLLIKKIWEVYLELVLSAFFIKNTVFTAFCTMNTDGEAAEESVCMNTVSWGHLCFLVFQLYHVYLCALTVLNWEAFHYQTCRLLK